MTADTFARCLFILGTISTIRTYSRNKCTPFLPALLDDLVTATLAFISTPTPEPLPPNPSFHSNIVRILDYLTDEAHTHTRPDIARLLTRCRCQVQRLPARLP